MKRSSVLPKISPTMKNISNKSLLNETTIKTTKKNTITPNSDSGKLKKNYLTLNKLT